MSLDGVHTYAQWQAFWRERMAEKRNDDKGYERGAKGIDGKDGEGFDKAGLDKKAIEKQFGRGWPEGEVL